MLVLMTPPRSVTYLRDVELYSTFIKKMKADNPQLNVSEVSFAPGKAGKNSFGKRNSSGISNVSNAAVDGRLFEKHEYRALTPDQNMAMLEKTTLEMAMATERTAGRDLQSNLSPVPSRH
jgi:hypothetical protein